MAVTLARAQHAPHWSCSSIPTPCPRRACLDALRACAADRPAWGAWQALVTMAGGELVNTAGNVVHYLGFGWAGDLGRRRDVPSTSARTRSASARAPRSSCAARPGTRWAASTQRYFMYGEDLDLSLRLRLAGWGVGIAPGRPRRARLRVHQGRLQVVLPRAQPLVDARRRLSRAAARARWLPACWPSRSRCCRRRLARRVAAREAARAGRGAAQPPSDAAPPARRAGHARGSRRALRGRRSRPRWTRPISRARRASRAVDAVQRRYWRIVRAALG